MDHQAKNLPSVARPSVDRTFSEAEYSADAGKVIAHAAATGIAIVTAADGRPRVIISIPTQDLPTLDG